MLLYRPFGKPISPVLGLRFHSLFRNFSKTVLPRASHFPRREFAPPDRQHFALTQGDVNRMRSLTQFFLAALLVVAAGVSPAFSQASSSTAELRGQVTDSSGAAVAGATVTITDTAKGTSRTTQTDAEGNYVFLNLLPSAYELKVSAASGGFAPGSTRVELTVGQQANRGVTLSAQGVTETIDVVAGGEVVDTDRTQQSSVIGVNQITNLPISRRNYLDYALLTPGVSDADNIADASDFRVAQTPNSGLSFGGNNGRGNLVAVDGGSTNT